jgi:RHS repeat-associated protein
MVMPGRMIRNGKAYRYGYQGEFAETDEETGKPAFQLRIYDPRINRWMSPDPAGQYHSPYMAMGNNWITRTDPDGGEDIYELQDDGTTKLIELTDDNFDILLDKEGVHIGQVNKGFLSDGLNIRENGLFLDALNKKDFQSYMNFTLDLSIAENKEIAGFIFDDSSNFDDIFIAPYKNNTYKSAPGLVTFKNNGNNIISERIYKVGASFHRANSWFHTHPGGTGFDVASGDSKASRGDLNFTKAVKVPGVILSTFGGIGFIRSNGVQSNNDRWKN